MREIVVTVLGVPAPQGSKRHVGRGILIESSARVKPWREAVKYAIGAIGEPMTGPVHVDLVFTVAKPTSAPKRSRSWPVRRPDLDKLIRSTLDGITDSHAIKDDSQIVELTAAKCYPDEGEHALNGPGAWLRLRALS